MKKAQNQARVEPKLLDHHLIPHDQFKDKLKAIMSVPKSELDARLAAEAEAKSDKPKRATVKSADRE